MFSQTSPKFQFQSQKLILAKALTPEHPKDCTQVWVTKVAVWQKKVTLLLACWTTQRQKSSSFLALVRRRLLRRETSRNRRGSGTGTDKDMTIGILPVTGLSEVPFQRWRPSDLTSSTSWNFSLYAETQRTPAEKQIVALIVFQLR